MRILKKMKIIEYHCKIMKIINKTKIISENNENHENLGIEFENHENHKNQTNQCDNHENHDIHKIPM